MNRLACYETRHPRDSALAMHRHGEAYAALVLDGCHVEHSLDGPQRCEPGTLVLHPRYHAHGNRFDGHGARVLNLPLPIDAPQAVRVLRVPHPREAEATMRRDPGALPALLAQCRDADADGGAMPVWARAFVADLCAGDEPVADLARRFGVSPEHASRTLRSSHGMPPQLLRREARWRQALQLLAGDAPLAAVAAGAGFADQSHLTRVCRAQAGLPPQALRRQIKCVQDRGTVAAFH